MSLQSVLSIACIVIGALVALNVMHTEPSQPSPSPSGGVLPFKYPHNHIHRKVNTDVVARKVSGTQNGELAAVVVTVTGGASYDNLFTAVPQKAPEGFRVDVYSISPAALSEITKLLRNPNANILADSTTESIIREIVANINSIEKSSVVFNWECCSLWSNNGKYHFPPNTLEDVSVLISRGYMTMFSDFSLKALINDWNEQKLGPNPFIQIGEFGNSFRLNFAPEKLVLSPSAQLQKVGELCRANGTATVGAMGGTIAYTVDLTKSVNWKYNLEVLTIVTDMWQHSHLIKNTRHQLKIGDHTGVAGHVLLTYPSGGKMLVSCGHWAELSRLEVSVDELLKVAESFGTAEYQKLKQELASANSDTEYEKIVQDNARNYVRQSVPVAHTTKSKPKP